MLGVWEGAAIGIGVAIGAGIFRTPGYVAGFLDAPWKVLAAWTIGGLLVLGDSLILAELATRMPRAGGWYVYIERGWGRFPAFLYGWTYMLVVDPASSAALVVVLGEYLAQMLGIGPAAGRLWAIGVTLALFGLSLAGIRVGSRMQDALTYTKLAALLGVGVLAFLLPAADHQALSPGSGAPNASSLTTPPGGSATTPPLAVESRGAGVTATPATPAARALAPEPPAPEAPPSSGTRTRNAGLFGGLVALGLALQGVLWTFEGYSNTTTMTEESINPARTLPRALVAGSIALGGTYLVVNAAYLHALGRDSLAASALPAADLASRLFGAAGTSVFLFLAIFAALGSLNGAALSAPRVAYALARSGLAPEPLTRVTRLGTPDLATLWFAAAWTAYAFLLSFEALVSVSIFIGALANIAVTATIFTHRRRDTAPPEGVFLSPLYPALPLVMLGLWTAFAADVLYHLRWKVGYGLLATGLAAAVYLLKNRTGPVRRVIVHLAHYAIGRIFRA